MALIEAQMANNEALQKQREQAAAEVQERLNEGTKVQKVQFDEEVDK